MRAHAYTHIYTDTHTHTYKYTHTHTHTFISRRKKLMTCPGLVFVRKRKNAGVAKKAKHIREPEERRKEGASEPTSQTPCAHTRTQEKESENE